MTDSHSTFPRQSSSLITPFDTITSPNSPPNGPSTRQNNTSTSSSSTFKLPAFIRRLPKPSQMDFELAVWEMTTLIHHPKRVFRSIYYHKLQRNTWHRSDPSFTYLLGFFMTLTSIAWGLAYADGFGKTLRMVLVFVFGHFLGGALGAAGVAWGVFGRVLGRRGREGIGRGQAARRVESGGVEGAEELEFGYCFDVAIRAFFPVWVFLYVIQFLLMPVVAQKYWVSLFFGNLLYLIAFGYYAIITFLGYNTLPFLHRTELLLVAIPIITLLWILSLFGFNMPQHMAPVLWAGAQLRKGV